MTWSRRRILAAGGALAGSALLLATARTLASTSGMAAVDCADLAAQALRLERGGVGYYRASNFVHLDTGPFRTWKG